MTPDVATSDGRRLWFGVRGTRTVSVYDPAANRLVSEQALPDTVQAVQGLAHDGERLYSAGASRVYRYAPDTLAVDAVFGLPPGASELAVSDGVLYVLVPSGTAGAVLRLDAQTGALLGSRLCGWPLRSAWRW